MVIGTLFGTKTTSAPKGRDYTILNQAGSPEYAELLRKEKNRELKSEHPTVVPRAALLQREEHIMKEVLDEETNTVSKEFREDVVVAKTDGDGRLWFEKGKEDQVRSALRDLRRLDKEVSLDPEGLILPEEMTEEQKRKSKGGRPSKESYKRDE